MRPIWNEPALTFRLDLDEGRRTFLVASELHLGYEGHLARLGAFLKSRSQALADRLLALAHKESADQLILLGDIKHRVTHLTPQEKRDVPAFFERLASLERVHVALGNHDAGLASLLPPQQFPHVKIHPATGFLVQGGPERVACLHGHAWPGPALMSAETVLVGHTHAAVALVDEHGRSTTEWAWVRGRLNPDAIQKKYGVTGKGRVIVFPPFNPLLGGTAVNREGILGPLAKLIDPASLEAHLLDGRSLGSIEAPSRKGKKSARPTAAS